ncbi:Sec-independent protein translocase subunit TatA [Gordonia sp. X0973]|uniref:Sec-independent protein translocase subunit TatA n=1 Tax=Gordonia sp. X0973 TaxID=2742602 RepID=UPI000F533A93|nr:Sec-independent protein translocase subunit TatA [Gordonia sp. X0973]QKT07428.1 Sec-independent protein translocase subunit TatA [Gordonia sp. X0973]
MWGLTPTHLIIVLIVFLVLFGAGKLPAAARGLGQSLRVFKSEMREMSHDGDDEPAEKAQRELPPAEKAADSAADPSSEKKTA